MYIQVNDCLTIFTPSPHPHDSFLYAMITIENVYLPCYTSLAFIDFSTWIPSTKSQIEVTVAYHYQKFLSIYIRLKTCRTVLKFIQQWICLSLVAVFFLYKLSTLLIQTIWLSFNFLTVFWFSFNGKLCAMCLVNCPPFSIAIVTNIIF